MAQQFVNYVAEETVKLSRGESAATRSRSDRRSGAAGDGSAAEAGAARNRRAVANAAREPNGALQPQIEAEVDLLEKVRQSLMDARSDIAEYQEEAGLRAGAAGAAGEGGGAGEESGGAGKKHRAEERAGVAKERGAAKVGRGGEDGADGQRKLRGEASRFARDGGNARGEAAGDRSGSGAAASELAEHRVERAGRAAADADRAGGLLHDFIFVRRRRAA